MARSISEIYNQLNAEKETMASLTGLLPSVNNAQTLLADLNSPSKVANWRLFLWVVAFGTWVFENLLDAFKAAVETIIANFRPGTLRWYQLQAFSFQNGHELVWNATTRNYEYATNDDAAKIVKYCAATAPQGIVRIKAAKQVNNEPAALTVTELARLQAYYFKIGYPIKLVCVSYDADLLKIYGTVKFNPLVDPQALAPVVESVINNHLKNLEFDGRFNVTKLVEAVLAIPGVEDFTDVVVHTKYGGLAYQVVDDEYPTNAGYARIDTAYFPLSATLNYVPYV